MAQTRIDTIERLEKLAAWHRANAQYAASLWAWETRVQTAEHLERQAASLRGIALPQRPPKLAAQHNSSHHQAA